MFEGEKYVALAYKYRLIDQDYKLAVLDEMVCDVEYQLNGHSNGMWKEYICSPNGFIIWRKLCMRYPESFKRLIVDCIHYIAENIIKQFLKKHLKKKKEKKKHLLHFINKSFCIHSFKNVLYYSNYVALY